jgi:hypothetical protein
MFLTVFSTFLLDLYNNQTKLDNDFVPLLLIYKKLHLRYYKCVYQPQEPQ